MSYQYYDQHATYGGEVPESLRQQRPMRPPQGRRPPPPPGYAGQYQQQPQPRGPPPMRPPNPSMRSSPRQPQQSPRQQQYAHRPEYGFAAGLYDGSAYGEPEYEMSDHWPLPAQQAARQQMPPQMPNQPSSKGPPPQRPQRPDALPRHMQGSSTGQAPRVAPANRRYPPTFPPDRPHEQNLSHHGSGQWTGDGYTLPTANLPSPNNSRPITGSSTYSSDSAASYPSIPDFPAPQVPQQAAVYGRANQRPPLGPPPSARRGPSFYYGQPATVHPITEEEESIRNSSGVSALGPPSTRNHDSLGGKSYASSNAIPIGIPDYYLQSERGSVPSLPDRSDGGHAESPVEPVPSIPAQLSERRRPPPPPQPRDEASPEPGDLVRQASLGKMRKPSLTHVKSGDKSRKNSASTNEGVPRKDSETVGAGTASFPSQQRAQPVYQEDVHHHDSGPRSADATAGSPQEHMLHDQNQDAGYAPSITSSLDVPSDSEADRRSLEKKATGGLLGAALAKEMESRSRSRSPSSMLSDQDKQIEDIISSLRKGGAITSEEAAKLQQHPDFVSKSGGKRRPPRLNLDPTREAEARGSLTSLPDLIRRATRLASSLDRGRTASRLGMQAWLDGGSDSENEKNRAKYEAAMANRRSGSISDILGQFPPPALGTPENHSRTDLRGSLAGWSSRLRHNELPSDSDAGEARRARKQDKKSKKKRCCGMPLWLFLLLLCIVILLITAAIVLPVVLVVVPNQEDSESSGPNCLPELSCANGGINVAADDGTCRCLCVSGYTGTECTQPGSPACTSIDVEGTTDDATVGTNIPSLLQSAQSDFGIPLNTERILGLFSSADLSCASENALVTFSGLDSGESSSNSKLRRRNLGSAPSPTQPLRRQASSTAQAASAATSNGIVFDSSSAPSSSDTPSSSPDSASSENISNTDHSANTTQTLNFARVAVLYVFQYSGELNTAATAQERLQEFFSDGGLLGGEGAGAVTLGGGFTADLRAWSLRIRNGTVVGGDE